MSKVGRAAICSDSDIAEAVGTAWRILRPEPPPTRTRRKPHGEIPLEVIATELGCTRENVRLIERRALAKCRAWCDERGLDLWDMLDMLRR